MSSILPSGSSIPPSSLSLLGKAREFLTQRELAARLQVTSKTVARWERGETPCPRIVEPALREILRETPAIASVSPNTFTFVDLFAGIGGIRIGFQEAGGNVCLPVNGTNGRKKPTSVILEKVTPLLAILSPCRQTRFRITTCCWQAFPASLSR